MDTTTTYGHGTGPRAQQALRDQQERERLANDLARWAGEEALAAHLEDVAAQPEGRHYTRCCDHAQEDAARNEWAFCLEIPLDKLRQRHESSIPARIAALGEVALPEGAEERAADRAKREGVLPTA